MLGVDYRFATRLVYEMASKGVDVSAGVPHKKKKGAYIQQQQC